MLLSSDYIDAQAFEAELYKTIYNYALLTPLISELTVEDPAEAFEDLRDRNDLRTLLDNENFMKEGFGNEAVSHGGGKVQKRKTRARANPMGASSGMVKVTGKMGPPIDKAWSESFRTQLKMAGVRPEFVYSDHCSELFQRQWQRLMEMLILMHLNPTDVQAAKAYRLQVKERLYRFNFVGLAASFISPLIHIFSLTGNLGPIREGGTTGKTGGDIPKLTRRLFENIGDDQVAQLTH
jgi:histone acetyltransferase 1